MRLASLDVFRGVTIALMILVNQAGVADNVYTPLDHAPWNGWTPTDLVFPFFLFAVGMSMSFSFAKYTDSKAPQNWTLYGRILRRAVILFGIGLIINGFYKYDLHTIRLLGVLQRIGLVYLLTSLLVLKLSPKNQWAAAGFILAGYWIALTFIPVPGYGAGVLTREGNMGAYLDRFVISAAHLYKGDSWKSMGDPEGLFSTLPAVISAWIGYCAGEHIRIRKQESRIAMDLVLIALTLLAAGKIWGWTFPINKKIWTSSYTLFMGGAAMLLFAACYEINEVRQNRRWTFPFEVLGLNSIFAFVGSIFMIKILVKFNVGSGDGAPSLFDWINGHCFVSWLGPYNGPTLFALSSVLLWWLMAYAMYRKRWFLKV